MKTSMAVVLVCALICPALADDPSPPDTKVPQTPRDWLDKLKDLKADMPRADAEKVIAEARGKASTYSLYGMDTSDTVVYKLDATYVLVVFYRPGIPAPIVPAGVPGGPPKDGKYLRHLVTVLR